MPELPEVFCVTEQLKHFLTGQLIKKIAVISPKLRFPVPVSLNLENVYITSITRRGKYMLFTFTNATSIKISFIWHLGMTGTFVVDNQSTEVDKNARVLLPPLLSSLSLNSEQTNVTNNPVGSNNLKPSLKHACVSFSLENGTQLTYIDPRRFGFVLEYLPLTSGLNNPLAMRQGIDALELSLQQFVKLYDKYKARNIKALLLDQQIILGIGNIYANEILFFAGISPLASNLNKLQQQRLYVSILYVNHLAIAAKGSTISDYRQLQGGMGGYQHLFAVYSRKFCTLCKNCSGIKRITQAGRSTYYCPEQQL